MSSTSGRRRTSLSALGEPQALAGRPAGWAFLILCIGFLLLITVVDVHTGRPTTVGALQAVPVLAAGWLVSRNQVLILVIVAAVLRVMAVVDGGIDAVTASSQVVVLPFMAVVSQLAALAFRSVRRRASEDALISRVASIAASAEGLNEILAQILKEMAREGLRGGTIALVDEHQQLYITAAEGDLDPSVRSLRLRVGEGVMGRVAAEGRSVLVPDLDGPGAPPSPTRNVGSNARMRSLVAVPLRGAGVVIGVLEIDSTDPGRFSEEDLRLLEQLEPAISGAVQRAGTQQLADATLRQRVSELTTLLDAARGLVRTLDPAEILQTVVRAAAQIAVQGGTGGRRASVWRLDGAEAVIAADYDEVGISLAGRRVAVAEHPPLRRALHGETTSVPEDPGGETTMAAIAGDGLVAAAYAPIRVGAVVYGALSIAHRGREVGTLTQDERRLLSGVADLTGLALGNSERFQLAQERGEEMRRHGERMASLDKVKSEFLRLASHELRGPLTVLRGYISMLGEGSFGQLPAEAAAVVPTLSVKVDEMGRLIDQMLETARLEDSRLQLALAAADLRDLAAASAEALKGIAGGHRLRLDLPAEPVPVLADRDRAITIITNLIDNALKYSPGGGEVGITVTREEGSARLAVADTGFGIDADDLKRLFTRFGRIVTRENSHIPGTGLGLYLSRELAHLHGGDITAASTVGEGSTFTLTLPLVAHLQS